jgi:hypothetical protein
VSEIQVLWARRALWVGALVMGASWTASCTKDSPGGNTGVGSGGKGGASSSGGQIGSGGSGVGGAQLVGGGGRVASGGGSGAGGAGAGAAGTGGPGAGGASVSAGGGGGGAAGGGALPAGSIIVQDNFDSAAANGAVDAARWAAYPAGQEAFAPMVDAARAHSGSNSARVSSTSSGLGSFLVPAAGLPVPGNALYVRVFINWEKATSTIMGHSGFIVGAASRDESATEVRLGISTKGPGGVPRLDLNLQSPADGGGETTRYSNGFTDGGNPASFTDTGFQFAANTWTCVEAFFNGDPAGSEFRVWIDDSELELMHVTDFRGNTNGTPRVKWAPTYRYIKIGANDYDANLGHIWYDDVVIATARVGCDYRVP